MSDLSAPLLTPPLPLFDLVRQQLQRNLGTTIVARPASAAGGQLWRIGRAADLLVRVAPGHPLPLVPASRPELVLYDYVPSRLGQRLQAQGTFYADAAGNVWLRQSSLLLSVQGRPRPSGVAPVSSFSRRVELLRLLFGLLHAPLPPLGPTEALARATGLPLATVQREWHRLLELGLGLNSHAPWPTPAAVQYWLDGFTTYLRSRLGSQRYCPRDPARWPDWPGGGLPAGCWWSGEPAARLLLGQPGEPATYTLYTRLPRPQLVQALGLLPHPQGRVEILNAFAPAALGEQRPDCVAPLLAYADLLASRQPGPAQQALVQQLHQRLLTAWYPGA